MFLAMETLDDLSRRFGLLAIYLFGSRAEDGLRKLRGEPVERGGSDLDVGVVFDSPTFPPRLLSSMQVAFEDLFSPLVVDLVPLQRVDPLLAFAAIDGHRVASTDRTRVDLFELDVMRRAAELLPVQRQLERELYGVSTS